MSSKTKTGNISFDLKRFAGIKRDYSKEEVDKLKGTFNIEYTLCKYSKFYERFSRSKKPETRPILRKGIVCK